MACDAIGTFTGVRDEFVKFAVRHDPDGTCEKRRVGPDSPGPVDDVESLARYVFCPTHVANVDGEYGEIDESLFSDAMTNGCSVSRLLDPPGEVTSGVHARGDAIAEEIRMGANGRPPQPNRHYLGAIMLVARDIRAIRVDEAQRRVRIYDTSRGPEDRLHGDIVADATGANKGAEKTLRKQLRVQLYLLALRSGLVVSPHYSGTYDLSKCGLGLRRV
jgi:hypothetical protein